MKVLRIRNPETGEWQEIAAIKGDKGDTPVKGVDYFTDEDIEYIANKLPEIQIDLSGYATTVYVQTAINESMQDLTPYAKKEDIPSLDGYATEDYVDKAIEAIEIPETVDLSNYYNKTETNAAIKTAIDNIEFPTTDLSNYYTKQEVDNKGYQTADQVTAAITSALEGIENGTY